jgi:ABC-type multidrug transport system fused ATPase/permease subunit
MPQGTVWAFLIAWGYFFAPISQINPLTQLYIRGSVSAKRVFAIHDLADESHLTEGERPEKLSGHVRFREVSFGYSDETPAVSDISLEAA